VEGSNPRPRWCKHLALPTELTAHVPTVHIVYVILTLVHTFEPLYHTHIREFLTMKVKEKNKAITLRQKGVSMGEIARILNVAKSSVSYWVRDIKLTESQLNTLNKNGHSTESIEKRRTSRIANTQRKREEIMSEAAKEVRHLQLDPLWSIGVALYWGEGGKTQQTARLSNSDPAVIKVMMRFFDRYSAVSREKYRGHVHTFSHRNVDEAIQYWSNISGIPKDKFFRTYVKQSSASKKKRETLPYGTVQIYLHDSVFFFRLMGWIRGVKKQHEN
jgi:transposase-like protein